MAMAGALHFYIDCDNIVNVIMDINELKKLVKHSTAVLVLDDGEPSFAILNYDSYKDLILGNGKEEEKEIKINHAAAPGANGLSNSRPSNNDNEIEILERINKDILALKNEIEKEEKTLVAGVD